MVHVKEKESNHVNRGIAITTIKHYIFHIIVLSLYNGWYRSLTASASPQICDWCVTMWPFAGYSFPRKLELLSSVIGDTTVLCMVYHWLRSLSVVWDYVEMAVWSSARPWMNIIAQVIFQRSPCFVWDGLKGVCAFPWVKQKKNIFRIDLPDRAWCGGCLKV